MEYSDSIVLYIRCYIFVSCTDNIKFVGYLRHNFGLVVVGGSIYALGGGGTVGSVRYAQFTQHSTAAQWAPSGTPSFLNRSTVGSVRYAQFSQQ
jgi:hypothetical protein